MKAVAASRAEQLAVPDMGSKPGRKVAVVSCMDTRLDLYAMLGIEIGRCSHHPQRRRARHRRRDPLAERVAAAARHGRGRRDHARASCGMRRGVGGRVRAGARAGRRAAQLAARGVRGPRGGAAARPGPAARKPGARGQGAPFAASSSIRIRASSERLRRVPVRVSFATEPRFGRTSLGHHRCGRLRRCREARSLPPRDELHRRGDDLPPGQRLAGGAARARPHQAPAARPLGHRPGPQPDLRGAQPPDPRHAGEHPAPHGARPRCAREPREPLDRRLPRGRLPASSRATARASRS